MLLLDEEKSVVDDNVDSDNDSSCILIGHTHAKIFVVKLIMIRKQNIVLKNLN